MNYRQTQQCRPAEAALRCPAYMGILPPADGRRDWICGI